MAEMTRALLAEILDHWRPGSGEWSWAEEFASIIESDPYELAALIRDMAENGFREPLPDEEPVLLGDDGRVWEGHHRILAALCCDFVGIPVAYSTGGLSDVG